MGKFINLKFGSSAVAVLISIIILAWLYMESIKPLPGTKLEDLGRDHIPVGQESKYNSNPPTSGPHYEDWVRSGIYEEVREDRNLVHSLEHGYVIMSYNCDHREISNLQFPISNVYAHEEDIPQASDSALIASPSALIGSGSAVLSQNFKSDSCQKLVKELTEIYNKKGQKRLILIPRPSLDTRIALTAWGYIDKFDKFDKGRIVRFIDAHINNGPEKTME